MRRSDSAPQTPREGAQTPRGSSFSFRNPFSRKETQVENYSSSHNFDFPQELVVGIVCSASGSTTILVLRVVSQSH